MTFVAMKLGRDRDALLRTVGQGLRRVAARTEPRPTARAVASWLLLPVLVTLSGCHKEAEASAPEARPVRTITVARQPAGETVVLTGHIEAENEAALGFRISGRMIERLVNVGDRVKPGQVLAKAVEHRGSAWGVTVPPARRRATADVTSTAVMRAI